VKKIIANSSQVKELTRKREKACDGKVEVILNGIDMSKFKKVERDLVLKRRLKIPGDDKVVGIVANFRPMKHHHIYLKAAVEILKVRDDVSFVLIGQGELEQEVTTLGQSFKIGHKLYFTGPQSDVLPFLSIMDVGVNCSEREGLSNAVMEYMATGVPCVVSDAGGNPDLITHDKNGYVFQLDDYKALADLVLRLLDDESTRQRFTKNAREKIEKEMSIGAMLSQYEELYRSLSGMNKDLT
jgi:glycosyltransferase involved in cell wall biosynthesis